MFTLYYSLLIYNSIMCNKNNILTLILKCFIAKYNVNRHASLQQINLFADEGFNLQFVKISVSTKHNKVKHN